MFLNITIKPENIEKYVTPFEITLSLTLKNRYEESLYPIATGMEKYKNKIKWSLYISPLINNK